MSLKKAKEIFKKLDTNEKEFVIRYFEKIKLPDRWEYSKAMGVAMLRHKWPLSKGFDTFKDLSVEELKELKQEI